MRMRALWKDVVLAESDDTVVVEGNHYFPRESLNHEHFTDSDHRSVCAWMVKDRVAFWRGVDTVSLDSSDSRSSSS